MTKVKVLVVDDSALMRKYLREMLEESGYFEVSTARDGLDALKIIPEFDPDVITLDINMPVMDGLTCLSHIMVEFPRPVIMVSSLTDKGALATFEALELGAIDYISKPGGTISLDIKKIKDELIAKIKAVVKNRASFRVKQRIARIKGSSISKRYFQDISSAKELSGLPGIVLIGSSTGGPGTLEEILSNLPTDFPLPIVIAQHMPRKFTSVFANRLNKICPLEVVHVEKVTPLEVGKVYIAQGNADIEIGKRLNRVVAKSVEESSEFLWHPAVDRLVFSALKVITADKIIAILLTGMGYDGAKSMTEVNKRGGVTIAESEETAVVFGMPYELIKAGGADFVLPSYKIVSKINKLVKERILK